MALTPERLGGERWFAAKGRAVERVEPAASVAAGAGALTLVDVRYRDGSTERYAVPEGEPLWGPLLRRLTRRTEAGFRFEPGEGWPESGAAKQESERSLEADQSNSCYVLGERALVKCYRLLRPGVHPEVELVSFLGRRFAGVPSSLGSLRYADRSGREWTVALVQEWVASAEDGWTWCRRLVEEAAAGTALDVSWARAVGALTAELHAALAELGTREAKARELSARRSLAEEALQRIEPLAGATVAAGLRPQLALFEQPAAAPLLARVHGDYHVGQVLRSAAGFHVIDFEGEPTRPLEERRRLDSPLRDVASMLRSIDHVPLWVLRDHPERRRLSERWAGACRAAFLHAYAESEPLGASTGASEIDHALLRAFEAEKAAYEFAYAESFLPEWLPVAAAGAELLLSREVGE